MAQNQNLGGNINLIELLGLIGKYWNRTGGLLITFLVELLVFVFFNDKLNALGIIWSYKLSLAASVFIITWIIWLLSTKRLLFRNSTLAIVWLLLAIIASSFFWFYIYPQKILSTQYDLSFVQVWGTFFVFVVIVVLGLLVDNIILKGKGLFIVFAVDNKRVEIVSRIKTSINHAKNNILKNDPDLKIEVLPFGILEDIKKCERFIKRPYTRADAIVFASVIDDGDEYAFVDFSSRINERRFSREERGNRVPEQALSAYNIGKTWNFINAANDNCSRTIAISRNLEEMLRIYIGCIYLMKHEFDKALNYSDSVLPKGTINNASDRFASRLFVFSYLSSAKQLETESHDIEGALNRLQSCVNRLPATENDPFFNQSMARVMFYKNDLQASKNYTKKFKDIKGLEWGYELNMGFYAIVENQVESFVRHYRHLIEKCEPQTIGEIDFAIGFLKNQIKTTTLERLNRLLSVAIAYLYMYKNIKVAKRKMKRIQFDIFEDKEIKELTKLKLKVNQRTETIKIKQKKTNS